MHRIDGAGATGDNKFTKGNPSAAVPATTVTDEWLNAVQEEILSPIFAAGLAPSKADSGQLLSAIRGLRGVSSIKDHGAIGDGVADDSGARTLGLADNLALLIPKGSYKIDGSVRSYTGIGLGLGALQSIYGVAATGQILNISKGYSASPDTVAHPLLKVERIVNIPKPGASDRGEELAAIFGITSGTASNAAQTVGVYGGAKSAYSGSTATEGDACGLYGVGLFSGSGSGTAIGAFVTGRRETPTGRATALEATTQNYGGVATTYNATGYSAGIGAWINAIGNADSGVGIALGNPFGQQFDVGLAFNGQFVGGKTGPVSGICIRDDSAATTFMDVRGTHTTGILIRAGAGNMAIGSALAVASYKLYVQANADSGNNSTALVLRGNSPTHVSDLLRVENSAGLAHLSVAGTGGLVLNSSTGSLLQSRYGADGNAPTHDLQKSRSATLLAHTAVQAGDVLGAVRFSGSDGTDFVVGGQVFSQVVGVPSAGDVRSELTLSTRGSGGLLSRVKIGSEGDVYMRSTGVELTTNATAGFTFIPTVNGVATGVPANGVTGALAMIFDRASNKLGVFNGSWKWSGAFA
jgi:hypothetical protein